MSYTKEQKQEYYQEKQAALDTILDSALDKSMTDANELKRLSAHYRVNGVYRYSFMNSMLILWQGGTIAQSYSRWKALERQVKKGEHQSIYIWRPSQGVTYKCRVCGQTAGRVADFKCACGKANHSKSSTGAMRFSVGGLFDVKQTEGKALEYEHNSADILSAADYDELESRVKAIWGYDIEEYIDSGSRGYVAMDDNTIHINGIGNNTDKCKTLIHELAHKLLGHTSEKCKLSRPTQEVEAEAAAMLAASVMGANVSISESYIAKWNTEKADVRKKAIMGAVNKIVKGAILAPESKEVEATTIMPAATMALASTAAVDVPALDTIAAA